MRNLLGRVGRIVVQSPNPATAGKAAGPPMTDLSQTTWHKSTNERPENSGIINNVLVQGGEEMNAAPKFRRNITESEYEEIGPPRHKNGKLLYVQEVVTRPKILNQTILSNWFHVT